MYWGDDFQTKTAVFKITRCHTGSQRKACRIGVTWSRHRGTDSQKSDRNLSVSCSSQ